MVIGPWTFVQYEIGSGGSVGRTAASSHANVCLSRCTTSQHPCDYPSISGSFSDFQFGHQCIASGSQFVAFLALCCIFYIQIFEEEALYRGVEFVFGGLDSVLVEGSWGCRGLRMGSEGMIDAGWDDWYIMQRYAGDG
mmetsp:Transcript_20307/g.34907  ORF Transcript_20307/g.34907 Transcript_20307/m.34907 type:complete len:138 (-) Transcript_20307:177-590(-)